MKYDIIRFYVNGKKQLVMANVSEEKKDEWCNSPKTKKLGQWFDGFVIKEIYDCQNSVALYPPNYSPDNLK